MEKETIVCFKCNAVFECQKNNKCPNCGTLNIHKIPTNKSIANSPEKPTKEK
jgi:predicted RNA-binding Zn-ribbon protein involved in translation (DUF1610 family)